MAATKTKCAAADDLGAKYRQTRALTEALAAPLGEADAVLQSMPDASPAKWHLAHVTWFWETFLLRDHAPGYRRFDDRFPFIFNSYYEAEGERVSRDCRGMLSRPLLADVLAWRVHVDAAMDSLLDNPALASLIELGIAHEQQHQELLLTDIKHAFAQNPLGPAMWPAGVEEYRGPGAEGWHVHPGGVLRIGHDNDGFAFDNEGPAHRVLLEPFALAKGLVTNGGWEEFIGDGGYSDARLWLSDGWSWVQAHRITAPEYWRENEMFTHTGWQQRRADTPVTHISFYEADAFATWAGCRLPTEAEWEVVAQGEASDGGNQLDKAGPPLPMGGGGLFGDCWQFTRSAYLPYPRFRPAAGAIGEYNGKFMSGQVVLRGASCATPRGHSRPSYRNFFYPHQRWQFTGLRLARDV